MLKTSIQNENNMIDLGDKTERKRSWLTQLEIKVEGSENKKKKQRNKSEFKNILNNIESMATSIAEEAKGEKCKEVGIETTITFK